MRRVPALLLAVLLFVATTPGPTAAQADQFDM